MVNLTKDQQTAVDTLESARNAYDAALTDLEAQYESMRENLKRPIRVAVANAERKNVPSRRIHLALGFGQISQLHNFLRPPKGLVYAIPEGAPSIFGSTALDEAGARGKQPVRIVPDDQPGLADATMLNITNSYGEPIHRAYGIRDKDDMLGKLIRPSRRMWDYTGDDAEEILEAVKQYVSENFEGEFRVTEKGE